MNNKFNPFSKYILISFLLSVLSVSCTGGSNSKNSSSSKSLKLIKENGSPKTSRDEIILEEEEMAGKCSINEPKDCP